MYYGFSTKDYKTLPEAAEAAAEKIYACGIGFRDGVVGPGGNNVWANNAANAFTADQVAILEFSTDEKFSSFGTMIALRQEYAAMSLGAAEKQGRPLLEAINVYAEKLIEAGLWNPKDKPNRLVSDFCSSGTPKTKPVDPYGSSERAQLAALFSNWGSLPETCKRLNPDPVPRPK